MTPEPHDWMRFFPAMALVGGIIYGYSDLNSQVQSLREWRAQTEENRFTDADARVMREQIQSEMARLRSELGSEVRTERAFTRALCHAISNMQQRMDLPVTNDCNRP